MNFEYFQSLYKTWSNDKLLDVLDKPQEYKPIAVEAAKQELERRQLNATEMEEARLTQVARKSMEEEVPQRYQKVKEQIKGIGSKVIDTNLIEPDENPIVDKVIFRLCLLLVTEFLLQWYIGYDFIIYLFQYPTQELDFNNWMFLYSTLLPPIAAFLLWKRNWWGWNLTMFYFVDFAVSLLPTIVVSIAYPDSVSGPLDLIFPKTSPIVYSFLMLLHAGAAWTLCKTEVKAVYGVSTKTIYFVVALSVFFFLLTDRIVNG